jgi:hypothetical protein
MKLLPSLALTILCLVLIIGQTSAYEITYFNQDNGTTTPISVYVPSVLNSTGSCTAEYYYYGTGTSGTISHEFYTPDSILQSTISAYTYPTAISCQPFNANAIVGTKQTNGLYEAYLKTTFSSASMNIFARAVYNCTLDSQDYFTYYGGWLNDSYGHHPYGYLHTESCCECGTYGCGAGTKTIQYQNVSVKNVIGRAETCGSYNLLDDETAIDCGLCVIGGSFSHSHWVTVPFNSGELGKIDVDIYGVRYGFRGILGGFQQISYQIYVIDSETNATYNLASGSPASFSPISIANYSLSPNTDYYIAMGFMPWGQATNFQGVYLDWVNWSLRVFGYQPDWVCTEWSNCTNGTQNRYCYDNNGRVTPKTEPRACIDIPYLSLNLGFDIAKSYQTHATRCYPDWYCITCALGCAQIPVNKTVSLPSEWTTTNVEHRDMVELSTDDKTEGSYSLKMWYIPPANVTWIPSTNICTSSIYGYFSEMYRSVSNASIYISTPVTFPSDYMTISFDYRKCYKTVVQQNGVCGKVCYGSYTNNSQNCDDELPDGDFVFYIRDNASTFFYPVNFDNSDTDVKWRTFEQSIEGLNLDNTKTYEIGFGINVNDPNAINSHCVYLDNVNVLVRTTSVTADNCGSAHCDGDNFIIPEIINGTCTRRTILLDSDCMSNQNDVSPDQIPYIENCSDYCKGDDRVLLKLVEGGCTKIGIISNYSECVAIHKNLIITQSMNEPIKFLEDIGLINRTFYASAGLTWSLFLFSPTFVLFLLALLISGGITFYVRTTPHAGMFGIIIFFMMMSIYAIGGLYPAWFIIMEIIIAAFLLARFMISNQRGG